MTHTSARPHRETQPRPPDRRHLAPAAAPALPMPAESRHACTRRAQRAIRPEAVDAALCWGLTLRQPLGRTAHFLGERAVAAALRAGHDVRPFVGTTVVVGPDGGIVTVLRSQDVRRLRRPLRQARGRRRRRRR